MRVLLFHARRSEPVAREKAEQNSVPCWRICQHAKILMALAPALMRDIGVMAMIARAMLSAISDVKDSYGWRAVKRRATTGVAAAS